MATYSGLWDGFYGVPYAGLGVNTPEYNSGDFDRISKRLKSRGHRSMSAILSAVLGAAAGGAASATHKRVSQPTDTLTNPLALGGQRTINNDTLVSRNTTAADVTLLKTLIDRPYFPTTYPRDASGNGGGSKVGAF